MTARRSATLRPGVSPTEAVRATRAAQGFTPAPSRINRKGGKGRRFSYEETGGRSPGQVSRLVDRARAIFSQDKRPDVPLEGTPVPDAEQAKRDTYLAEARRQAERLRSEGQNVRVTTQGGIQLLGERGRIAKNLRPGYRGTGGRFARNIERPIRDDPAKVRDAAEDRVRKASGFFGFGDRAGFTPARERALKLGYALDRQRKGQPFPTDWLNL